MAVSFLKKGNSAKKTLQKEEAIAEAKADAANEIRRFWIPPDAETSITFLDGDLDDDGVLANGVWYEHNLELNGHWRNWFVCVEDEEPCPVCEDGHKNALVSAFTVIDHSQWTDSNNVKHKDEVRLFVVKRATLKILQKLATKRGGLTGCTFDVSRSGKKVAGVGDIFDFDSKSTLAKLKKQYKVDGPLDYEEVIHYKTAKELRKLGFGSDPIGSEDEENEDAPWDNDSTDEEFDDKDI